jgi:ataxia telangiectasia mutated family protein
MIDKGSRKSADHIGAHSKYYPGEWGSQLCREYYRSQAQGARRKAFDTICEHHSPVFRYFFVERFGNSLEAWHSAKMRYTRSVAVNSVVGHILGIGDRHTSNILVHETTGEVVHIDFGIVFEQGKVRYSVACLCPFRTASFSHAPRFPFWSITAATEHTREGTLSPDSKYYRWHGTHRH